MSAHSLAELEVLNSALSSKDSTPHGLSNANHTLRQSLESTGPTPLFMKTLRRLIGEQFHRLTSSPEGFPVKTSAMLENALALRGVVLHSGNITSKRLGHYDQNTSSLRTFQRSLIEDLPLCLLTLPRSGMMQNGIVYQLPPLVRLTAVTESSSLLMHPTPDTSGLGGSNARKAYKKRLQTWPTPTASDHRNRGNLDNPCIQRRIALGKQIGLTMQAGGQLNPTWVEWLMGFPLEWTALDVLAMQSYQQSRKSLRKRSRSVPDDAERVSIWCFRLHGGSTHYLTNYFDYSWWSRRLVFMTQREKKKKGCLGCEPISPSHWTYCAHCGRRLRK